MSISEVARLIDAYEKDIILFVNKEFGVTPEPYQEDALRAFADPTYPKRKCVMQSAAGVGKSAVLSWGGHWFLVTKGLTKSRAKGVALSMTKDNLVDGLWRELSIWLEKSKLLQAFFEINQKRLFAKEMPNVTNISVRSYNKNVDREEQGKVLSGLHGENLLYLVDESGAIIPEVGNSINQGFGETQAKFVRLFTAGNPMEKDSLLFKESEDPDNWRFKITADPDDPKRSQRVDAEYAAKEIKAKGRKNPWVMTFILSEFPEVGLSTLLNETEIDESMARENVKPDDSREMKLGVDVARFGMDSNVWAPRQGLFIHPLEEVQDARTSDLFARTVRIMNRLGSGSVYVDGTGGYGAGLVDMLYEAGYSPHEINFGSAANNEEKFFNKRSEMYWNLAQAVKRGARLPFSAELKRQLSSVLYTYDSKQRVQIEGKEQIRKRLKISPDEADAVALTYADPDSSVMAVAEADVDTRPLEADDIYGYGGSGDYYD